MPTVLHGLAAKSGEQPPLSSHLMAFITAGAIIGVALIAWFLMRGYSGGKGR